MNSKSSLPHLVSLLALFAVVFSGFESTRTGAQSATPNSTAHDPLQQDILSVLFLDGLSEHLRTEDAWERTQNNIASFDSRQHKGSNPAIPAGTLSVIDLAMASLLEGAEGAPSEEFEKFADECWRHVKAGKAISQTSGLPSGISPSPPVALASAYGSRGYKEKASQIFEGEILRLTQGHGNDQLAETQDGYGSYLTSIGKLDEAEGLFRQSLALRQKQGLAGQAKSWLLLAGLEAVREHKPASDAALESAMSSFNKGTKGP